MKTLRNFIMLCRPQQWYKNLLVFLAVFFSGNLMNLNPVLVSVYAFIILVAVSSGNYIINDIIDAKKDRLNPEKKKRPIASRKIKIRQAAVFASLLIFLSLFFSAWINMNFFYSVLALFLISLAYSIALKKIFLVDAITISSNFVIRAVSGAFAISVFVSPWLVAGIFIFAFFLVSGKRYGEVSLLGKNAEKHRAVLKYYTKKSAKAMMYTFALLLLLCFALFSWFGHRILLWNSLLFACLVARYLQLAIENPAIAANPERAFSDRLLLVSSVIFIIVSAIILYAK